MSETFYSPDLFINDVLIIYIGFLKSSKYQIYPGALLSQIFII